MARISRNRHAHQTAIANDGTKDISANQWNDVGSPAHIETGMFGLPTSVSTVVLSGNALLPVDSNTVVQASGSPGSDTLKNITNTNTNAQDILFLTGNSADTITVNHHDSGTGNIFLLGAINKVLDTNVPMVLIRQGTIWYELTLNGGIVNANISASAAITYGKLNLSGSILNADISNSAAIAYSKLNLGGSILNADLAGSIAPSKITGTASILGANTFTAAQTLTGIINTLGTALGTTGTINLDFSTNELTTMPAMTGNVTFTTSNLAAGVTKTIRIIGGASAYTFTFPATWKWLGTAPTNLAIGKYAVLTLTSFVTTDADVVAAYAVQP